MKALAVITLAYSGMFNVFSLDELHVEDQEV